MVCTEARARKNYKMTSRPLFGKQVFDHMYMYVYLCLQSRPMSTITSNEMTTAKPITRMSFSVLPVNVRSLAEVREWVRWKSGVKEDCVLGGGGGEEGERRG